MNNSVSQKEISLFSSLAHYWWDPKGPMRVLHDMNPLRVNWAKTVFERNGVDREKGKVLDLGCGAGIATESLARFGYHVTGADVSSEAIDAAQEHAQLSFAQNKEHAPHYVKKSAEQLVEEGAVFDAITAFELIEHTNDPADYMYILSTLLKPGAPLILSTMNRSWQSLLVAKIGAEYILRLLPVGTHEYKKFITPVELSHYGEHAGLRPEDEAGMSYSPQGWRETTNMSVNYLMSFIKI